MLGNRGKPGLKTTLIVCPVSLMHQWYDEIMDKTVPGTFDVLIYHGSNKVKSAKALLAFDVVITSYNSCSSEWRKEKV